jgi:C4-dicarboxylate transporter
MGAGTAYHHRVGRVHVAGGGNRISAQFSAKQVFTGLEVAYRGMADAFASVVMLLVAAGVFAQGLSTVGFISGLISLAQSFGTVALS